MTAEEIQACLFYASEVDYTNPHNRESEPVMWAWLLGILTPKGQTDQPGATPLLFYTSRNPINSNEFRQQTGRKIGHMVFMKYDVQ
jgi:hypothetical protein